MVEPPDISDTSDCYPSHSTRLACAPSSTTAYTHDHPSERHQDDTNDNKHKRYRRYNRLARPKALVLSLALLALFVFSFAFQSASASVLPDPHQRRQVQSQDATSQQCSEESDLAPGQKAAYAILVPILVVLSGLFAGLTLGYMSLDETQLQVLSTTGTEKQKEYARKIMPIRKDGHLLLTTLLIANMITNETLPIISDPLFPSPVIAVVVSTVLVIIFAELVPQSVCSRYGLQIGAYMAPITRLVLIGLWPIAWPVSRILHWTLGPHHGIVYRRAELKELVTMHAAASGRGGDLKGDTIMMVGGALDLQEKVVSQAKTPIDKVFMLPFDAKLDYPTLQRVVRSGHSRIPIYQEIEVPSNPLSGASTPSKRGKNIFTALTRRNTGMTPKQSQTEDNGENAQSSETPVTKRKNIIGTLLVKSCVLLDPEDAVPVSDMTINALPTVPSDEPLHNVLNAFQEGRSHMAIVTSLSRTESSIDSSSLLINSSKHRRSLKQQRRDEGAGPPGQGLSDIDEEHKLETRAKRQGSVASTANGSEGSSGDHGHKFKTFWRKHFSGDATLEQGVPSDAEVGSEKTFIPADAAETAPSALPPPPHARRGDILGVITLEDVLEELIGEEIYDEYDPQDGDENNAWNNMTPPLSPQDTFGSGNAAGEKGVNSDEDMAASGTLSEPALQDEKQSALENTSPPAPTKTFLNRLGLTGRPRGSAGSGSPASSARRGTSSADDPPASPAPPSSPVPMSPEAMEGALKTDNVPTGEYFAPRRSNTAASVELDESRKSTLQIPGKSASAQGNLSLHPSSRPTTPGVGQSVPGPTVASPQPNRPVVLRKTVPGGGVQNVLVGENMLRGRRLAPGTPVVAVPASVAALSGAGSGNQGSGSGLTVQTGPEGSVPPTSRSSTPKPSRFKSTPAQAIAIPPSAGGAGTSASPTTSTQDRFRSPSRSRSLEPTSAGEAGSALAGEANSAPQEHENVVGNDDDDNVNSK
ncbi:unnamed protein product [Jaminaea pallidilutea]